jgi:hypothetical protein
MITEQRCISCNVGWTIEWDDYNGHFQVGVEDDDNEANDPAFCPFCGEEVFEDTF